MGPRLAFTLSLTIIQAHSEAEIGDARALFQEYAASLHFDLCFQGFAEELAGLPGAYAPPQGRLLLAKASSRTAGCVALRRIDGETGELKRLYVRPGFRGQGVGRALAAKAIEEARAAAYRRVRLDTLASMTEAQSLYRSLGFYTIEPYRHNPVPGAVFLELAFP
ncbi:MAG: GNAT family N-acetyltransferase [Terriglobia bacterium]